VTKPKVCLDAWAEAQRRFHLSDLHIQMARELGLNPKQCGAHSIVFLRRSYWIPGSYAPSLSKKHHSFLRLLKNKGFKAESMTQVGLDAIGTSTTLESNKSLVP